MIISVQSLDSNLNFYNLNKIKRLYLYGEYQNSSFIYKISYIKSLLILIFQLDDNIVKTLNTGNNLEYLDLFVKQENIIDEKLIFFIERLVINNEEKLIIYLYDHI